MIKMIEESRGAVGELLKVIKWIRAKFGRQSITPNLREKIRAHLNILEDFHESYVDDFHDKEGKAGQLSLFSRLPSLASSYRTVLILKNIRTNQLFNPI